MLEPRQGGGTSGPGWAALTFRVGSGALEGEQRWEDELQVGISRTDVLIERWKQSFDKLMNEEHAGEDRVCVRVTQVDRRGHRDNGPEQQK